ncbi:hypothetical protein JCM12141A_59460 [Mycolicibacterium hodleri]
MGGDSGCDRHDGVDLPHGGNGRPPNRQADDVGVRELAKVTGVSSPDTHARGEGDQALSARHTRAGVIGS